jgi:prophage tail gpP-like protein
VAAIPYAPSAPDSQSVRLLFSDYGRSIDRWVSYEFSEDFLTPTDSFSFVLGTDENGLDPDQRRMLKIGARIRLYVENVTLAEGFVDAVEVSADRSGGWTYTIHGRDRLGQTLDTVADPTFQLKTGGTLAEFLQRLFYPFGWIDEEEHFGIDNEANRDARTGIRGTPFSKGGKKKGPKPLKGFVLHQTKPYNHESVFHFASRVAQRHGLWIWCTADGEKLIVSKPEFDQEPIYSLYRGRDGRGNILSGSVKYDMADQPTMIIADSFSGGAEFGKGRCKAYIINPLLGLTDEGDPTDEVKAVLAKHPAAVENTIPQASIPFRAANVPFRPMFLHDDESKTQEQLNNFVKREMSLMYRKAVTAHYVVEGHGQEMAGTFVAWATDTIVEVFDEVAELAEEMYVLGVHFSKSRGGSGTTTRLDLVRRHSIVF